MTKVAVLGLTGVLLGLMMKELNPGFSVFVSMAACVLIFFYVVNRLSFLSDLMQEIQGAVPVDDACLKILLKMIGVTYLADFTANLCRDAGYSAHRGAGGIFREDFSSDLKLSCAYGTDGNH